MTGLDARLWSQDLSICTHHVLWLWTHPVRWSLFLFPLFYLPFFPWFVKTNMENWNLVFMWMQIFMKMIVYLCGNHGDIVYVFVWWNDRWKTVLDRYSNEHYRMGGCGRQKHFRDSSKYRIPLFWHGHLPEWPVCHRLGTSKVAN